MRPVYVRGLGFFTPGFATPEAWSDRKEDSSIERPEAAILEGPLRRRATPLSRLAIESLVQATNAAQADLSTISTIWATAHGEHTPAIKMLRMMRTGEGRVSPTQFHNSVHNTASGYASIASKNTGRSTTLTGGSELVGAALLEAWCLLEECGGDVGVILADEPLQPPYAMEPPTAPLSLAFVLSSEERGALGCLTGLRRCVAPAVATDARFGYLHIAPAVALLESLVRRVNGTVVVERGVTPNDAVWTVNLECRVE
jgi:hypothetical protein